MYNPTMFNPDEWNECARQQREVFKNNSVAFKAAAMSIRAKAYWVLVNGKWVWRAKVCSTS